MRLSRGRSTPAIRAMSALPLLVSRVLANHPDPAAPADDATLLAHLLGGRTNLHTFLLVGPASRDRRHIDYVSFSISSDGPAVGSPTLRSAHDGSCLLYTSPSPRDGLLSRMPS